MLECQLETSYNFLLLLFFSPLSTISGILYDFDHQGNSIRRRLIVASLQDGGISWHLYSLICNPLIYYGVFFFLLLLHKTKGLPVRFTV